MRGVSKQNSACGACASSEVSTAAARLTTGQTTESSGSGRGAEGQRGSLQGPAVRRAGWRTGREAHCSMGGAGQRGALLPVGLWQRRGISARTFKRLFADDHR